MQDLQSSLTLVLYILVSYSICNFTPHHVSHSILFPRGGERPKRHITFHFLQSVRIIQSIESTNWLYTCRNGFLPIRDKIIRLHESTNVDHVYVPDSGTSVNVGLSIAVKGCPNGHTVCRSAMLPQS